MRSFMYLKNTLLATGIAISAMSLSVGTASAEPILNVATAGSQNMVDYVRFYLAPKFEATHPGVKIKTVGTGPGDAGSQKIFEKLEAQKKSNATSVDMDVAVVHQKMGGLLVDEGLLANFRDVIKTGHLVTRATAKNALGVDVDGYVFPMFHSQTAIAYNSDVVKDPPTSYEELVAWTKKYPKQFGYNGIKNGMSGVSFVVGLVYSHTPDAQIMMKGPYDSNLKSKWGEALNKLKEFNKNVSFTPGNAGTLDMLNRGEIVMGPVWVDMFYTWMADGKIPPNLKLKLIAPGMPGQPMFYVIPKKAANMKLALDFLELATSPEVQAEGIVKKFNWYPGIDAHHVKKHLNSADWSKLFVDVTPQDLAKYGKTFPIVPYFDDVKEAYERQVSN